jgi:hypothetical protein
MNSVYCVERRLTAFNVQPFKTAVGWALLAKRASEHGNRL